MSGRLFSMDEVSRSIEKFHYDEETGKITIEDVQNVTPILDANAHRRSQPVDRNAFKRHVASVPANIYWFWETKWRNQGMSKRERMEMWKKFLNDPDNKQFKTIDGRI